MFSKGTKYAPVYNVVWPKIEEDYNIVLLIFDLLLHDVITF